MALVPDPCLSPTEAEELRRSSLTYPDVGATRGRLPSGYSHLTRTVSVSGGRARFEDASRALLGWEMHRRAGLTVRSSDEPLVDGAVAVLRLGLGRVSLRIPVRVVYVVDEPRRRGFAYGTLPGHPECGEELFLVQLGEDDQVTLTIRAFSRPATVLARVGGPVSRRVQRWMTERYLRVLSS